MRGDFAPKVVVVATIFRPLSITGEPYYLERWRRMPLIVYRPAIDTSLPCKQTLVDAPGDLVTRFTID